LHDERTTGTYWPSLSACGVVSHWTFQAEVLRLGHGCRTRVFRLPGGRVRATKHGASTSGDARDEELKCYVSRSETMHGVGSESQERTTSPGSTPSPFRRRLTNDRRNNINQSGARLPAATEMFGSETSTTGRREMLELRHCNGNSNGLGTWRKERNIHVVQSWLQKEKR